MLPVQNCQAPLKGIPLSINVNLWSKSGQKADSRNATFCGDLTETQKPISNLHCLFLKTAMSRWGHSESLFRTFYFHTFPGQANISPLWSVKARATIALGYRDTLQGCKAKQGFPSAKVQGNMGEADYLKGGCCCQQTGGAIRGE